MATRKLNLEVILVDLTFCQNKKDILKFKKKKVLVTFFIKDTINIAEEQTLKMVGQGREPVDKSYWSNHKNNSYKLFMKNVQFTVKILIKGRTETKRKGM